MSRQRCQERIKIQKWAGRKGSATSRKYLVKWFMARAQWRGRLFELKNTHFFTLYSIGREGRRAYVDGYSSTRMHSFCICQKGSKRVEGEKERVVVQLNTIEG